MTPPRAETPEADEDIPSGLPEDEEEHPPLGMPGGGEEAPPGEDAMPGIAPADEPDVSG
jgi:hypothetical protein